MNTDAVAFPPPFRAMLALNSDVEFTSWSTQIEIFRLLADLGLETACAFWCWADESLTWSVFDDNDRETPSAAAAFELMRGGLLDTLHSFGGASHGQGVEFDRRRIEGAYRQLADQGICIEVYSNHGGTLDTQNVGGSWASYQEGDVPGRPRYHLDISVRQGLRFFWTDIDYDNERCWFSACGQEPLPSIFVPQIGRDGTPILRFRRYRGKLQHAPYAGNLANQLRPILDGPRHGYCVVYQHLGVHRHADGTPFCARSPVLSGENLEALQALARLQQRGELLVTTTQRLLRHALIRRSRCWTLQRHEDKLEVVFPPHITVEGCTFLLDWAWLAGWCIPVEGGLEVQVRLGGESRKASSWVTGEGQVAGLPWPTLNSGATLERALARLRTR